MRVAILGAGSIAYGTAGLLAHAGHTPVLWSPSRDLSACLGKDKPLTISGALEGSFDVEVAAAIGDAVTGADAVLLALPVNGHRLAMDAALPHLRDGQPVIISSHGSFAALYLRRKLADRGITLPIIVWGTTVVTGRKQSDSSMRANILRPRVDMATLPGSAAQAGLALCTALFGDRFVLREGLIAISLSNLNPQNHLGIAMFNLTRMENGETWVQGANVTPAVGRLIEALDRERLAIAKAFGLSVKTVQEHFSQSFQVPMASVSQMNQQMTQAGRGGVGPSTIDSRYLLEDVPYGLVPTAMLGRLVGRPAVLHEAGIALLSAAMGRDFAAENDLLPDLALDRLTVDELRALCG